MPSNSSDCCSRISPSSALAFIEHLCTYALRRVLTVDDENDLDDILDQAKNSEYRVRDIVRAVALSDLMQKR